jgi:alpha-1,3-rhamnosyl/mannosyltransferase
VIYGGVDLEVYRMRPRPEHDGSLVFLGRILPHKGVHFLIDAAPADCAVHVLGPAADAAYLADLKRRAQGKRVEFHHGLTDAEVVAYLQRAMALVHPTPVDEQGDARAHELFGLALVEAMACGCPVIASNAASIPELVAGAGVLVRPSHLDDLSDAIARVASAPDWSSMAAASRKLVAERFSWRSTADRCRRAYEAASVTGGPAGAEAN